MSGGQVSGVDLARQAHVRGERAFWPLLPCPAGGKREQGLARTGTPRAVEPSPRVRGAVDPYFSFSLTRGTIPAGAGSSGPRPRGRRVRRDHPRGCGEQAATGPDSTIFTGPSPRVRGAVTPYSRASAWRGAIPADAGSRSWTHPPRLPTGGHPRGCGEQPSVVGASWALMGPSPRVQGAGRLRVRSTAPLGAIPAGAGSRTLPGRAGCAAGGHPRGCGEQTWLFSARIAPTGPSPRVRGADLELGGPALHLGAIPAGAGSRAGPAAFVSGSGGHPRGCGEQAS